MKLLTIRKNCIFLLTIFFIQLIILLSAQTNRADSQYKQNNYHLFLSKDNLQQLYAKANGHCITNQERSFIAQSGGDATYGEITYESMQTIIDDLKLTAKDVFCDLGCGTGKVATHVYFNSPVSKSIGIELSETRFNTAQKIKQQLEVAHKLDPKRRLLFFKENIMFTKFRDISVIYLCSTCYPEKLMQALTTNFLTAKKNVRILTLKQLPKNNHFKLVKTYTLAMTWSPQTNVYLYTRIPNKPEKCS
jgi:hypothetical protein